MGSSLKSGGVAGVQGNDIRNAGEKSTGNHLLPAFTFRQADVKRIEFQALPGPEARALRAKTMRHISSLGPGGQAFLFPRTGLVQCRGARVGARCARLPLRKRKGIFGWILFPADAFSAQCPCFWATSSLFSRKGNRKNGAHQNHH